MLEKFGASRFVVWGSRFRALGLGVQGVKAFGVPGPELQILKLQEEGLGFRV